MSYVKLKKDDLSLIITKYLSDTYRYSGFGDVVYTFASEVNNGVGGLSEVVVACSDVASNVKVKSSFIGTFQENITVKMFSNDVINIVNEYLEQFGLTIHSNVYVVTQGIDEAPEFISLDITCEANLND